MKELREILRWFWLLSFLLGCTASPTSTDHPRHHRHEKSRLRRQHGAADPSVFYLIPSDPNLPPDQSQAESGDWGPWSAPSECSRTCGGGVQFQTRECSPYSRCVGSKTRYFSCNIQDCPEGTDFRAEQCAEYNHIEYEGKTYEWIPYRHAENQCALNCMPKGERYYYRHKDAVHDGTPCNEDSLDVCVQGKCLPVGCDKLLGSLAREDSCRVCGGDGSTCTKKSGVIETNAQPGYVDLFLIPANATNIRIQERRASNNYLAIRNQNNDYYLNGGWTISNSGPFKFAGTKFHYSRKPFPNYAPEVIYALGPTTEPLFITLLYQEHNPGIEYVYSVPVGSIVESPKQGYTWRTDPFSECNVTCGGGIQTRKVWCAHESEPVGNVLCDSSTEPASTKSCGMQPCPAEWVVEKWSPCSAPCGELGYQTRQVTCMQSVEFSSRPVTEHLCKGEKPVTSRQCQEKGPCPIWHIGPWKPCDRLCGEGKQKRDVICYKKVDGLVEILPDSQCLEAKPEVERTCLLMPCEGLDWITSDWSGCSDKCGQAIETRIVMCADEKGHPYNESMCHSYRKPETVRNCTYVPCSSQWFTSQWNECSAKCGLGIQTRSVICASLDGNKLTLMDNGKCEEKLKPEGTMECRAEQECKGEWFVSPFGECSKPCGGGTQERSILCLKDNMTVSGDECDKEHFIVGNSKECNTQPCGEDELIPVSTAQVITEEESEECDYDYEGDYDESSTDTDGLIAISLSSIGTRDDSDDIEGSGGYSDDLIFISSTPGPDGSSTSGISPSSSEGVSEKSSSVGLTEAVSEGPSSPAAASLDASTGTLADEAETGPSSPAAASLDASTGTLADEAETGPSSPAAASLDASTGTLADEAETGPSSPAAASLDASTGTLADEAETGPSSPAAASLDASTGTSADEAETGPSGADGSSPSDASTPSGTDASASVDGVSAGAETESSGSSESSGTDSPSPPASATDSSSVDASSGTGSDSTAPSGTESASVSDSTSAGETSGVTDAAGDTSSAAGVTDSFGDTSVSPSSAALVSDGSTEQSSASSDITGDSSSAGLATSEGTSDETTVASVSDAVSSDLPSLGGILTTESSLSSESSSLSSMEMIGSSIAGLTTEGVVSKSVSDSSTALGSDSPTTEGVSDSSTPAGGNTEMATEGSTSSPSVTDSSESTDLSSSGSSSSPDTTDLAEAVFGVTTESDVDKAIKKEKKLRKCKRRKGKRKCVSSTFGCCPDGKTEAKGPFSKGCPIPKTCKESKHGCCPDGLSPAKGPNNMGCPKSLCDQTLFGCCPDKTTPSMGNNFEGCPVQTTPMPDCSITEFGCCPDGKIAEGPYFEGCTETCSKTAFGCCPDGFTVKTGLDYEGCDIPNNETCSSSEFGCCPDGLSVATGPDDEGCQNCTESRFGCCPDGILAAKGIRQFGCAPACSTSDFGCCSDNKTFAHGPNQEGCCLNTAFGCCPDNVVPAQGANYLGCDCRNSAYGCCPDGKTSATGPDNLGCGCQYSEFGCCPDRQTEADGPSFEGCACHTYQFGCCPDGVTIAKGPNLQGCGCEHSAHGCCPDGQTPKEGPDQNCTCEATKFGCCPDGVNEAKGDEFEGCENVPITGEVCSLPRTNGECRDFKIVYWFDNTYGGCARFWYGGCGGNKNRFKTLEECQSVCVRPTGKDLCSLPMSPGSCRNNFPMWYYDKTYRQCRPFSYTGCLGNSNRFHTREECELQCGSQEHLDPCEQTLEHGPCNGTFERWYYNKEDRDCIPFTYGGCKGTKNNFLSQAACKAKCIKPDQQKPECSQPKAAGTCTDKVSKWYFEPKEMRCMPFYYSGCGGNGNHFDSLEDCNGYCPVKKEKDTCVLPSDVGSCTTYMLRWYFDTLEKRCKQFYWGSCGGNGNNFATERECLRKCDKQAEPEIPFSEEMCSLPPERGQCSESIRQWHYDRADGTCKVFDYSGCEGNGNRFETEEICVQSCGQSQDPCSLPKVSGPGDNFVLQWYFDQRNQTCRQFYYGGSHGNANRFPTAEDCRASCQPDYREGEAEPEQPQPEQPQPEPEQPQPEPEQPRPEPEQPRPRPPVLDDSDICYLRFDPGPCYETIEAWYWNPSNEVCTKFIYGGCQGNANRFSSEEQCERQCGLFKHQEVCSNDVEVGSCNDIDGYTTEKYYFERAENDCRRFNYSGCGGNGNRFSSLDECRSVCLDFAEPKIPQGTDQDTTNKGICRLPMEPGPCEFIKKRYFYDENRRTCNSFVYSGCGGNLNNFLSFEDCTNTCVVPSESPDLRIDQPDPNSIDVGVGPIKEDCPSKEDCADLRCPYGIEKWVDSAECERCRCHNPCASCPGRCEIRLVPEELGNVYRGHCEGEEPPRPSSTSKDGQCPEVRDGADPECTPNCNFDHECSGSSKCCYNGCTTVCTPVVREPPPRESESPPYIRDDTDQRVEAEEGNLVGLHCIAGGTPTPTVAWKRNGEMLSPISGSKYRISQNGTLEIILLKQEDEGTYTCEASNGIQPSATRDYDLIVKAGRPLPVAVVNNKEDTETVVTLGSPAVMRCYAIGFPVPDINWFRGTTVLPISDGEYEQRRDNSLFIRAVSLTNLGFYTCQVYNGQGRPASRTLVLKAFGPITGNDPNDLTVNEFLVPSSGVSSADANFRPPPPYQPAPEPQPPPTEPLRFGLNTSEGQHVKAGSNLTLTCNLLSQIDYQAVDFTFRWMKNDVDLSYIEGKIIPEENRLLIINADEEDSGNYSCLFEYGDQEGLTEPMPIVVQRTLLHAECKDHKALANCSLIVMSRYCVHKYYAKFCCKSCTEAGQLPSHTPGALPPWENLQAHFRRPRSLGRMLPSRLTPVNAPDHESDFKVRFENPIPKKFNRH